ncbi:ABC transporter transmembrane domain-containing protein [Billgrantia tianxiuensis]|uniref:ABC transporter transmembrane domain-containing protein n=1 Tax=Billgrantia tianxiuensis TaxID=2497861 RepID=UPI0030ED59F6
MSHDLRASPRRWLAAHAARQRGWLGLAALAGIAAGALTIVQMALLAWIVSRLLVDGDALVTLSGAFIALVGVLLLRAMCQWGQELAGQEASLRIRESVRAELLDHLAAMGPVRAGSRHTAALASQLVEQVEALDGYFARFLPQLRLCAVIPLLIVLVVLSLDWLAALFLLLAAPLIPLFMALVGMGRSASIATSSLSSAGSRGIFSTACEGSPRCSCFIARRKPPPRYMQRRIVIGA